MISAQQLSARRRHAARNRHALEIGEFAFLGLAVAVTSWGSSEPLYAVLVSLGGLIMWLLLNQPKHHVRRLTSRKLIVPLMTALFALIVLAVLREPYSGMQLLSFTVIWTTGMLAVRLVAPRSMPPVRVLLLGRSHAYDDLLHRKSIDIVKRVDPPESLDGWDVIAVDGETPLDATAIQWLSHAAVTGNTIVNAHNLYEELTGKVPVELFEGHRIEGAFGRDKTYGELKRIFDVSTILVLSPILLLLSGVVALVVMVDSGRPVLFWQERMGLGGRPFRMVKFRTMRINAEAGGAAFASSGDARITKTGKFLRKFRLDELPQFWNVLRGQMSIIGPRPEQVAFARGFEGEIPLYGLRHSVPPGITGWAQVTQGYAANADETLEKLRYDIYYIKHLSLVTDVKVLLRTAATVLTGFGAR